MIEHLFASRELVFLINLVLCAVAGFLIGIERESRHKDAGISTHMLVIMGSMLFTYISSITEPDFAARISAQIVTGIGFLGAGLILKEGTTVRNLTTAASLWYVAAIGMAFGYEYYVVGIMATLIGIVVPRIPRLGTFKKILGVADEEYIEKNIE